MPNRKRCKAISKEPWRLANGTACISVLHSDQWNWWWPCLWASLILDIFDNYWPIDKIDEILNIYVTWNKFIILTDLMVSKVVDKFYLENYYFIMIVMAMHEGFCLLMWTTKHIRLFQFFSLFLIPGRVGICPIL